VSDERQWEAPASPGRAPAAPMPQLAPPPSPRPSAWTPPPRPGLVPLRPLGLGTIIVASFGVLRRNGIATFGPALVVCLALAVVKSVGTIAFLGSLFAAGSDDTAAVGTVFNGISGGILAWLGSVLLDLAGTQIVLAFVSLATAGNVVGERRSPGGIWRRTVKRRGAVVAWAALTAAAGFVGVGTATGVIIAVAGIGGSAGVGAAVVLGLLAAPGALVLWFWLTTKLAFVPPALVVERLRMGAAIRRSWRLTRRSFWGVLGTRLLVSVMVGTATALLGIPIQIIAGWVTTLVLPNGATADSGHAALIVTTIVSQIAGAFVTAIALVLTTATTALLYVDVRMRKEGLDLELGRYVEHAPGARRGLPDPFRHPERPV
jgi:hypothetical protein